jgi:hypothetical protein
LALDIFGGKIIKAGIVGIKGIIKFGAKEGTEIAEKAIVYRVIRAEEDISVGLVAKDPNATYSAAFHVSSGSKRATQFISTTKSLSVAQHWAEKLVIG